MPRPSAQMPQPILPQTVAIPAPTEPEASQAPGVPLRAATPPTATAKLAPTFQARRNRGFAPRYRGLALRNFILGSAVTLLACAPLTRPASFPGARQEKVASTLIGPMDGQVVDAQTGEAIAHAQLVAVWDYDVGQGMVGPEGAEVLEIKSDSAGRYKIPKAKTRRGDSTLRLVKFTLFVYRRGYQGYRSDILPDGSPRRDFVQRHNRIALQKFGPSMSHAEHLLYMRGPKAIGRQMQWSRALANNDLYRQQSGMQVIDPEAAPGNQALPGADSSLQPSGESKPSSEKASGQRWLDATVLLDVPGLQKRSGTFDEFEVQDLADIERSEHYHGVHFRAKDNDVKHDFAYRVWHKPPEGLPAIIDLLQENLPDAQKNDAVSEQSWSFENEELRAVAFVDPETQSAVLVTCGVKLCADIETVVLVARHLRDGLTNLRWVDSLAAPTPRPRADPKESSN